MREYYELLKTLIQTPSISREETGAAGVIRGFLAMKGIRFNEKDNNTWVQNLYFNSAKPVILLNSHIDTVKPALGWRVDPFAAIEEGDKLTGLGSNDAGGSLVALLAVFLHFYSRKGLPFNLIYAATAEEEISGNKGIESIFGDIPVVDFAIVGEPTGMRLAVAEKGLMVLDCAVFGKAGHAAREEGDNAIYKTFGEINKLRGYRFSKVSDILGPVKVTVTQIEAGTQHNVIPDICRFVADVRTNELYTNQEAYRIISEMINGEVKARSFRLNSSGVDPSHPFVIRAQSLGISCFGSPTTSDQAVMSWPSVKIGPGDSARSHSADEYILKTEIADGVEIYTRLLNGLQLKKK